jgi:hypothetical protein
MTAHTERMIDGRWVADPDVVSYVTERGHLYCVACAVEIEVWGIPVYFDSAPHNTEPCDRCHKEPTR